MRVFRAAAIWLATVSTSARAEGDSPKPLDLSRTKGDKAHPCNAKRQVPTQKTCGVYGTLSTKPYSAGTVDEFKTCQEACLQNSPQKGVGDEYPCKGFSYNNKSRKCQLYTTPPEKAQGGITPDMTNTTELWSFHCYNCFLPYCTLVDHSIGGDPIDLINKAGCIRTEPKYPEVTAYIQDVPVKAGEIYVLSYEYKVISGNPDLPYVINTLASGIDVTQRPVDTDDSFQQYFGTFQMSINELRMSIQLYWSRRAHKYAFVQNVRLYKAPPLTPSVTDVITNGDFESGSLKPWVCEFAHVKGNCKVTSPGFSGNYGLFMNFTKEKGHSGFFQSVSVRQTSLPTKKATSYLVSFDLLYSKPLFSNLLVNSDSYTLPSPSQNPVAVERVFTSQATEANLSLIFESAHKIKGSNFIRIDNVRVRELTRMS